MSDESVFSNSKYISRVTTDNVRSLINKTGKAIFRETSGDDIGSDGQIELIKLTSKQQIPTGKIAFLQLKGTGDTIVPLVKTPDKVSVSVNHTTLEYMQGQNHIPVILIYSSLKDEKDFYFCDLRDIFKNTIQDELASGKKEFTVHIPIENRFSTNETQFFKVIEAESQ